MNLPKKEEDCSSQKQENDGNSVPRDVNLDDPVHALKNTYRIIEFQ